jgi:hypothetical protein
MTEVIATGAASANNKAPATRAARDSAFSSAVARNLQSTRSTRVPPKVVIAIEEGAEARTCDGETIVR